MMKKRPNDDISKLPHFSMSNNIPIYIIFSFMSKVASMIAIIFSLNGGLLYTQLLYCFLIYSQIKYVCLSVFLSYNNYFKQSISSNRV